MIFTKHVATLLTSAAVILLALSLSVAGQVTVRNLVTSGEGCGGMGFTMQQGSVLMSMSSNALTATMDGKLTTKSCTFVQTFSTSSRFKIALHSVIFNALVNKPKDSGTVEFAYSNNVNGQPDQTIKASFTSSNEYNGYASEKVRFLSHPLSTCGGTITLTTNTTITAQKSTTSTTSPYVALGQPYGFHYFFNYTVC